MTTTHQPKRTEFTSNTPTLPTGGDIGAGLTKLVINSGDSQMRLRLPSKILEITAELDETLSAKDGGHFYYHDGDRTDLIGREFLTGSLAMWKAPTTHIKLSDDPSLKVEFSLQCILGAIASLPYRPVWNLHLVLSIHDAKVFGIPLKGHVNGSHIISCRGKENLATKVNLTVSLVVPEGAGSYGYCLKKGLIEPDAHAIANDFGTSTVIVTVFGPCGGQIIYREVLEVGGCIDLLNAIASDTELIKLLGKGKAGSIELIRQGIESEKFQYGTRSINFKDIYSRHLTPWLTDRLRLIRKQTEEWSDAAQSCVAWGGGAELPGVSKLLSAEGIVAVPDGCWANSIGLQRIAEGRLSRGK